jgi:Transcriptional regulator, AbiEi antitoxin, Type IV TA system/Transcriptional regulator, AbiEi antitoxin N-terminal domain
MSIIKGIKLQKLMNFPDGLVLTASYLSSQGFGPQLLAQYKKSNWLASIGDGAYARYGDKVDWQGALSAMQNQLKLTVHCGARTALELQGYSHYVVSTQRDVFLFGSSGQKLSRWFKKNDWDINVTYKMTSLFPDNLQDSYVSFSVGSFTISISSPERAAMEMLYYVPAKQGFDEAARIMESLLTLRPVLVQKLLEACASIKVKRLFLYLAQAAKLPFVAKLDLTKVNLGKGDRTVVKGGRLDSKYRITVPRGGDA